MILSFLIFAVPLMQGSRCLAKVDYSRTKPLVIPLMVKEEAVTQEDVAEIIPMDLEPTDSQSRVLNRIADRSFQYWWNNSQFRYSSVGRAAVNLQNKLRTDLNVKGDGPKPIEHKFSMQLLAAQAIAKLEYTGWIKAVFKYYARDAKSETQVSEKIWNDKDLILSHTNIAGEDLSALMLKWSW